MHAAREAKGTLFHPHHVLYIAALRCIPKSAGVCSSWIPCVPVFTIVLAPGLRNPRNPFRTICYHFLLIPIRLCSVAFPPSANANDPLPEQYVNNCPRVHLSGA